MKRVALALGLCLLLQHSGPAADPVPTEQTPPPNQQAAIANPAIDMEAYLKAAKDAAEYRATHRLSEDDFIKMSREEGVIVLDARSSEKYRLLHVKGAINLSFPDIDVESLKRLLPDKNARILIYCNNNFRNAQKAFPTKSVNASLNLSTYISLHSYGYRNVYELGPQMDYKSSKLTFVGGPNPE
jgi:phage shock protein E